MLLRVQLCALLELRRPNLPPVLFYIAVDSKKVKKYLRKSESIRSTKQKKNKQASVDDSSGDDDNDDDIDGYDNNPDFAEVTFDDDDDAAIFASSLSVVKKAMRT